MTDLHLSDPILVVAVTVSLGFLLLLFSLIFPGEQITWAGSAVLPRMPPLNMSARDTAPAEIFTSPQNMVPSFEQVVARQSDLLAKAQPNEPQVPLVKAEWQADLRDNGTSEHRTEARERTVARPLLRQSPPPQDDPAISTPRLTWTSLVDESAAELDLPTRMKLIEALGLVGGNWSREILARAYEQELDPMVRGAVFLALRDSKSAAS